MFEIEDYSLGKFRYYSNLQMYLDVFLVWQLGATTTLMRKHLLKTIPTRLLENLPCQVTFSPPHIQSKTGLYT